MGMVAGVIGFFVGWTMATMTFFENMNWFLAIILTLTLGPAFGFIIGLIFSMAFGLLLGLTRSQLGGGHHTGSYDYQNTIDNEAESQTNENVERKHD